MRTFWKHKFTGKEYELYDTVESLDLVKLRDVNGVSKTIPRKNFFHQYVEVKFRTNQSNETNPNESEGNGHSENS